MSEMMSTGLCNQLLDTGSLKTAFNAAEVRIYSGTPPATADAAEGTVIAVVKVGGGSLTWGASAAGGVLAKAGTWEDASGTNAGGVASHYRLVQSADAGALSTSAARVQGTIGVGGADMNVGTTTIALHANFTLNVFTQSIVPN